eukprot:1294059-Amphidinium_carterae.1
MLSRRPTTWLGTSYYELHIMQRPGFDNDMGGKTLLPQPSSTSTDAEDTTSTGSTTTTCTPTQRGRRRRREVLHSVSLTTTGISAHNHLRRAKAR